MNQTETAPITLLLSYSHKDELLLDELKKHLAIMKRQGTLSAWHDRNIDAGGEWEKEISEHLESDDVILLLVSPDFLNSDYCWDIEMRRAIERHDAGEALVIPIFLRYCDWHGAPFAKLQGLPSDSKFVTSWADRDEAFTHIAKGIRKAIGELSKRRTSRRPQSAQVLATGYESLDPDPQSTVAESDAASLPDMDGPTIPTPVSDTGDLVLLDGQVFKASKVKEGGSDGSGEIEAVKLWIIPRSAEEEAQLRSFKSVRSSAQRPLSFAYRNHAFTARVQSATSLSENGIVTWELDIASDRERGSNTIEYAFNGLSSDQIAELRAKLLLLDEKPTIGVNVQDLMLSSIVGGGSGLNIRNGIFPALWRQFGDREDFLYIARLHAVYALIETHTCEHIFELSLGPIEAGKMPVKLHAQRHRAYSNQEAVHISFEGMCRLEG